MANANNYELCTQMSTKYSKSSSAAKTHKILFKKITTVLTHRNNKTVDVDNVVTYDHSRHSSPSLIYALEMAVSTIFCHAHTHIQLF